MNWRGCIKIKIIERKIILFAIGFAVLYWVIDSAIMVFILGEGAFVEHLITPSINDIWMRSTAMSIIIAFGVYAQSSVTERKRAAEQLQNQAYNLGERVKELNCLYGISGVAEKLGASLEEMLQEIVTLIPPSWQYPNVTCARINLNSQEFVTGEFRETPWRQISDITFYGNIIGNVEVFYLEERPESDEGPFLKEERNLINAIAERLGRITEQKQTEDQLQLHSEHLEEIVKERTKELEESQEKLITAGRLATLGQVSGSISHELRNPLAVIDSSVYYLRAKLKDIDKKELLHFDRIQSSVNSAITIIDSLLNLTRMKEPHLEQIDLVAVTRNAIDNSKVPSGVKIVWNLPRQEVMVISAWEQLHIALKNVIKNAAEAMDNKGTLTVSVQSSGEGYAEVSFTDTGMGIAKDNLEKIFEPLFTTKAIGIGFGLSISKAIIDKHNGTIEAKSEPGEGTTFVLRLPLYVESVKEE